VYTTSRRQTRALPIGIAVTVALSLFPASWLSWTSDLSDVVRVPVTPVAHVGVMIKGWVRPALIHSDLPTDEKERNELAVSEREHYRQMYHAQLLRSMELADQLRDLQSLPNSALRNPSPPVILSLDVTGNRPSNPSSIVELKLEQGVRGRILEGDVAVVGRDIIGRITKVSLTRISLMPSTNKEHGLIKAAIVPPNPKSNRPSILASVLLRSDGNNSLYSEAPATSAIEEGDFVVLNDPAWPISSAGLILGVVSKVIQLDEAPLRRAINIEPRIRVRDVSRVVVLGTGEEQVE